MIAETKQKLSQALTGRKLPVSHIEHIKIGMIGKVKKEDQSVHWKNEDITYAGIHAWMRRTFGKPCICENCGNNKLETHNYHWANLSGEYLRDESDWARLCRRCHFLIDGVGLQYRNKEDIT